MILIVRNPFNPLPTTKTMADTWIFYKNTSKFTIDMYRVLLYTITYEDRYG